MQAPMTNAGTRLLLFAGFAALFSKSMFRSLEMRETAAVNIRRTHIISSK